MVTSGRLVIRGPRPLALFNLAVYPGYRTNSPRRNGTIKIDEMVDGAEAVLTPEALETLLMVVVSLRKKDFR